MEKSRNKGILACNFTVINLHTVIEDYNLKVCIMIKFKFPFFIPLIAIFMEWHFHGPLEHLYKSRVPFTYGQ